MDLGTGTVRVGVRRGTTLDEAAVRRAVESAGLTFESLAPPGQEVPK